MSREKILYSLVARGTTVLTEFSTVTGNSHLVAHRILEKVPQNDSRTSYSQDRHLFHVVVYQGFTFLCMAGEDEGRRIPYAFLEDIKQTFLSKHEEEGREGIAYSLDESFRPILQERIDYFSKSNEADAMNRVRGELGQVRGIMIENIDEVLDRGERIELLVDKTDHLQSDAFTFTRESRRLKRKMWWQNSRIVVTFFVLLIIICYVIVCFACSPTFHC